MAKGSWVKSLLAGLLGGVIALSASTGYNLLTQEDKQTYTSTGKIDTNTSVVSSDTTEAIDIAADAVVSVSNYQKGISIGSYFGGVDNSNSSDNSSQLYGEGSGVIYKIKDNEAYVVTNYHVIAEADEIKVTLSSGKSYEATIVGEEASKDIAVLKMSSKGVETTATFADSSKLTVGEPAIAIGSPNGIQYANSATEGILSAVSRSVSYVQEDEATVANVNALQTDAAINPGNSGGALINIKGEVIGINSSKLSSTSGGVSVEGMGFAIPSNDVVNIIDNIEEDKEMPAIGISMQDLSVLSSSDLESLKIPEEVTAGVYIVSVANNLPAQKAGLKEGDIITNLDGDDIISGASLQSALLNHEVGDTIDITYYRNGKKESQKLTLNADASQLN
ncbi:MAG: S1C family serine protease [Lactovum sp.]